MSASIKRFAIVEEVSGTGKFKKTPPIINISKRVLRLKVVNDIVHGRGKRHEKLACFGFIRL